LETIVFCRSAKQPNPKGPAGLNKEQTTEKKCKGRNILENTHFWTPFHPLLSVSAHSSPFLCLSCECWSVISAFFVLFVESIFSLLGSDGSCAFVEPTAAAIDIQFDLYTPFPSLVVLVILENIHLKRQWSEARIRTD